MLLAKFKLVVELLEFCLFVELCFNCDTLILKAELGKKRTNESAVKTPVPAKKAKGAASPKSGNLSVPFFIFLSTLNVAFSFGNHFAKFK